ncbi:hypothetical protein N4G69_07150 [Streptomyces mirabilis]|uniref:hypothetical protein n=1 Tax=Streptomyces mirabilis TaxID=68239 RepID=UPI0021BF59DC|nr:hypothetical protein [Streptomyces mirabilis]MCT9105406.1 hypothetical protein [Streptomyces mirabilis]
MEMTDERLCVVFVHGFTSNVTVWDPFVQLIAQDDDLKFVTPLAFPYATPWVSLNPFRRIPSIDTVAGGLKEFLDTETEGFQHLMLVGHSQGGLVVQRYLASMLSAGHGHELSRRIRRVVLFACPNTGSGIGLSLRRWLLPFHQQERQLRPFNEEVARTQSTVISQVVHARETTTHACPIPFAVYGGMEDNIVSPASSIGAFHDAAAFLPGDHFTIVKPDSHRHSSYTAMKRHLLLSRGDSGPPVETLDTVSAAALEVQTAVSPGNATHSPTSLTPYLSRDHDTALRDALKLALDGGQSVLAVLTGDSSTGKTRALYEALHDLAPTRPLLRPASANDLLALIKSGRITSGGVLWLNEAQRFLDGSAGEQAAAKLRDLLERQPGVAAVGTLWTDPHWNDLTIQGSRGDPHSQARALLTGSLARRIEVASVLSGNDLDRWRDLAQQTGDLRLEQARRAGEGDGRVVQHLSGGPELLEAYRRPPGARFTHPEHALITAALDARRLGHHAPIPAALLADAADGALAPSHHSPDPDWADHALHALSTGARLDSSRTDVRHTLTSLTAVRPYAGAPAGYDPAAFLDQHTRIRRADQLGAPSLWEALTTHTSDPDDLNRLADAAWDRGLYKQAIQLRRKAVLAGHPTAHSDLIRRPMGGIADPHHHAALWVATHADLTNPNVSADLLGELREVGADQALTALMNRDPVAQARLTDPYGVASLLVALDESSAAKAKAALLDRDPASHVDLTDPLGVAFLVLVLKTEGADQALTALLDRDPIAHVDPHNPRGIAYLAHSLYPFDPARASMALMSLEDTDHTDVHKRIHTHDSERTHDAMLMEALEGADPEQTVMALMDRHLNALTNPDSVARLLHKLKHAHVRFPRATEQAVTALLDRAVAHTDLTDPGGVAHLLMVLRHAGADQAVTALLGRDPVAHVDLTKLTGVAALLRQLRETGENQAVTALLDRDPVAHIERNDLHGIGILLRDLREAGVDQAVTALLERVPIAQIDPLVDDWIFLSELRKAGAKQAADTLSRRLADAGKYQHHGGYGRETDGRPATPWTWSNIPLPS